MIPVSFANTSYKEGLRLMEETRERGQEALFFFEHPHTITLGNSTTPQDLLVSEEDLHSQGYDLHRASRGGKATYHGPGQLVCYPVVRLRDSSGVRTFVKALAQIVTDYLATLSIQARYEEQTPGLWVGEAKIAAFGLSVRRAMTGHGFALNLSCDLARYRVIVPCGLHAPVTSVKALRGEAPSLPEAVEALTPRLSTLFVGG